MSCPCIQTGIIYTCTESLTIGVIEQVNTAVSVWIKNTSTGRINKFDAVSGVDGSVTIDVSDFIIGSDMNYEVSISLEGQAMTETIEFTIGDSTNTCAWFGAQYIDGDVDTSASLTEAGEPSGTSVNRYRQITEDYTWQPNIYIVGVAGNTEVISTTVTGDDSFYDGVVRTYTDESESAGLYNHRLYGNWNDGVAYKELTADRTSIEWYWNGTQMVLRTNP